MTVLHGRFAELANMGRCMALMTQAIERSRHLPGLVVFHGRSGLGKSVAAAFVTAETGAVYVEARSTWTTKYFLEQIASQLAIGEEPRTIPRLLEAVVEGMVAQNRPLIIDEADHVLNRRYVEVIRDIYELSRAAIMLITEEHGPDKIKEWERVDNRVLAFQRAEPASLDDGRALRDLYCRKVTVADDLVEHFVAATRGVVRRIAVNLDHAQHIALTEGRAEIDRAAWGERPVFTGRAEYGHGRIA